MHFYGTWVMICVSLDHKSPNIPVSLRLSCMVTVLCLMDRDPVPNLYKVPVSVIIRGNPIDIPIQLGRYLSAGRLICGYMVSFL